MCYSVYLSTTSDEDLSLVKSVAFSFEQISRSDETDDLGETENGEEAQLLRFLSHRNCWYLTGKYGGCSCHFRHTEGGFHPTTQVESMPYFSPPESWSPEDAEDVESTGAFYDALVTLVNGGHQVEILDAWSGTKVTRIRTIPVSLAKVSRDEFRFFNAFRFLVGP